MIAKKILTKSQTVNRDDLKVHQGAIHRDAEVRFLITLPACANPRKVGSMIFPTDLT